MNLLKKFLMVVGLSSSEVPLTNKIKAIKTFEDAQQCFNELEKVMQEGKLSVHSVNHLYKWIRDKELSVIHKSEE